MHTTDLARMMQVLEDVAEPPCDKEMVPWDRHHLLAYLLRGWEVCSNPIPIKDKDGYVYLDVSFRRKMEEAPEHEFEPDLSNID